MLQQTTVVAVIPYFERFLARFPDLKTLAQAPLREVLEQWTGLGYYSRARNLHKAAQVLASLPTWPRSYLQLLKLPGFGPYTARAVAALAFGESVGVLDGNVIRILSRVGGEKIEHWTQNGRSKLQALSDHLAAAGDPSLINQAMMELGATLCTPQSPQCFLCPWLSSCQAQKKDIVSQVPLKKPRRTMEVWLWKPIVHHKKGPAQHQANGQVALVENAYAPFLKGQWLFPGQVQRLKSKPKKFDLRHTITHHEIYVQIQHSRSQRPKDVSWVSVEEITNWNPSILLRKVLSIDGKPRKAAKSS